MARQTGIGDGVNWDLVWKNHDRDCMARLCEIPLEVAEAPHLAMDKEWKDRAYRYIGVAAHWMLVNLDLAPTS